MYLICSVFLINAAQPLIELIISKEITFVNILRTLNLRKYLDFTKNGKQICPKITNLNFHKYLPAVLCNISNKTKLFKICSFAYFV